MQSRMTSSGKKMSGAATVWIVVGVVLVIGIIITIVCLVSKKDKKLKALKEAAQQGLQSIGVRTPVTPPLSTSTLLPSIIQT